MLSTPFRDVLLPSPYAQNLHYHRYYAGESPAVGEFVAWLRGEQARKSQVNSLLMTHLGLRMMLHSKVIEEVIDFTIISSDGERIEASSTILKRLYTYFDDYLSEFPNEREVTLPFEGGMLRDTLEGDSSLAKCLNCLLFLSPKDPFTYLSYETVGLPTHRLNELSSRFTDEQKAMIVTKHRVSSPHVHQLPLQGMGIGFLAAVLEYHSDVDNLLVLFSDYPSYLTMFLSKRSDLNKSHIPFLLAEDFTIRQEVGFVTKKDSYSLIHAIGDQIEVSSDWNTVKRLLTMLEFTHTIFGNEKDYVAAPYLWRRSSVSYDETFSNWLIDNIVTKVSPMIDKSEDVVRAALNESYRRGYRS